MKTKLLFLFLFVGFLVSAQELPNEKRARKTVKSGAPSMKSATIDSSFIDITLPFFDENASFTETDTLHFNQVYNGEYEAKMYHFVLTEEKSILINMSSDSISDFYFVLSTSLDFQSKIEKDGNSICFNKLAPGEYFLYMHPDGSDGNYSLLITTTDNEIPEMKFESIFLPYKNDSLTFIESNDVYNSSGEMLKGFTFNLTQDTTVYIFASYDSTILSNHMMYSSNQPFHNIWESTAYAFPLTDSLALSLKAGVNYLAFSDQYYFYNNGTYYTTFISISLDNVRPVYTTPLPVTVVFDSLTAGTNFLSVSSDKTENEIKIILSNLQIYALSDTNDSISIINNIFNWTLTETGEAISATFETDNINVVSGTTLNIMITKTNTGTCNTKFNDIQAIGLTKAIQINNAEGQDATIYDLSGSIIKKVKCKSSAETVSVNSTGVYIVYLNGNTTKVFVK